MEEDFTDDDSITMEEGTNEMAANGISKEARNNPDPLNMFRSNISANGSIKGSVKYDIASFYVQWMQFGVYLVFIHIRSRTHQ